MTAQQADALRVMPTGPSDNWPALAVHRALKPDQAGPEPTGFAACALGGGPRAAGEARQFTTSTLRGWNMTALVDDTGVIVSELVSNAARYGLSGHWSRPRSAHPLWLGLLRQGATVLCAVADPSSDIPVVKEPDSLAESGRGLHVIDSLSESWGWTAPDRSGKAVWALVSASA